MALIPLLHATVGLAFWQLLALVFLGALLDAPGATAREAMLPDLADLAQLPMARATAADDGVSRSASLIGAPLAGVLIAVLGPAGALWFNAASFAISALLIGLAVPRRTAPAGAEHAEPYLAQEREGLGFPRSDRLVGAIVVTVMVTNLLDAALFSVAMPIYFSERYGSALALGLTAGIMGGAALLGTLIFGAVGHRLPRRVTFASCFLVVGLRFWIMALFPSLPLLMACTFLIGLAIGPLNPIMSMAQFERTPAHLRARVLGAITAGVLMAVPLGVLVAGYLLEWAGLRWTLLLLGACYVATTASIFVNPAMRELDRGVPSS